VATAENLLEDLFGMLVRSQLELAGGKSVESREVSLIRIGHSCLIKNVLANRLD